MRRNRTHAPHSRSLTLGIAPLLALLTVAAAGPGCAGDAGADGAKGVDGAQGGEGKDGTAGANGKDGASPVIDQSLSPLDKAFVAIGGKEALAAFKTVTVTTAGARSVIGETRTSADPPVDVSTFSLGLSYDVAKDNLRLDYKRKITFIGIEAERTYSEILLGKLGYIDGIEHVFGLPAGNMVSDRWASIRKQQRLLNPHLILRDAAADPTLVSDGGVAVLDGGLHHLVTVKDKTQPVTLFVNTLTGTIDKATTREADELERDIELEVFYEGWKLASGGLFFPSNVYLAKEGEIVHEETRSSVKVNEAIDSKVFTFPAAATPTFDEALANRGDATSQYHQSFASLGIPLDGLQTFVQAIEVAPKVFFLAGGSHNSMAIEQQNGVVIIEAPLYEERSSAILNWVGTTFPSKPVTHVIATHFHTDHAGGLRRFVAAGAKIVVGEAEAGFFRKIFKASSATLPDELSKNPKPATIIPVPDGGSFTIADAVNPVAAYHLETTHSAGMLLGYLPAQKLVFNSDLYNPASPAAVAPPFKAGGLELYNAITVKHQLLVDLIAGGHGGPPNTFGDFKTALGL